jgi:hypothetical protein
MLKNPINVETILAGAIGLCLFLVISISLILKGGNSRSVGELGLVGCALLFWQLLKLKAKY